MPLTPMTTPCVMDVNVPLLCFPLEPFGADETATVVRIEGSLVGRCRGADTLVGAVDFGLPTTASTCMTKQVARLCESGLAIPTSVVVRHLFDVSDQECMPLVETHCQNRPANFVIVGGEMGQGKVTVWLNRVSCNALFEVLFKQRQMLVGQTVTQAWALGEESFSKLAGSANVVSCISTPMNSNAAEETKIVPKGVERKNAALVAKPIRKTPEPQEQRLTIQDDFGIDHEGLFIRPLGVGSMLMLQPQLFLLFHPVFRSGKCFKPRRVADGLVIRDLLTISNVSQLDCAAEFQLESRFDMLHDLALNLFGNGAFQIQVEAKQECSPALFHSMLNTLIDLVELPAGVVQRVKLFHDLVNRKSPPADNALLFVKPSI